MVFRTLKADEIDVRVSTANAEKGASYLLYKDARCDMNILDETVGAFNWKREHTRENANCIVSIYDAEKHEWISKEDTGTESFTEAEKGLASDSFKRACVNWGIGRELYTAPFIFIPADKLEWRDNKRTGKKEPCTKLRVTKIGYDEKRRINVLVINSEKGVVFEYFNDIEAAEKSVKKGQNSTEKRAKKATETTAVVKCPICGKEVKPISANGKTWTPAQIIAKRGMCPDCYKVEQIIGETNESAS